MSSSFGFPPYSVQVILQEGAEPTQGIDLSPPSTLQRSAPSSQSSIVSASHANDHFDQQGGDDAGGDDDDYAHAHPALAQEHHESLMEQHQLYQQQQQQHYQMQMQMQMHMQQAYLDGGQHPLVANGRLEDPANDSDSR